MSITDSPLLADLFVPSARSTEGILAPLAIPSDDPHATCVCVSWHAGRQGFGRIREPRRALLIEYILLKVERSILIAVPLGISCKGLVVMEARYLRTLLIFPQIKLEGKVQEIIVGSM